MLRQLWYVHDHVYCESVVTASLLFSALVISTRLQHFISPVVSVVAISLLLGCTASDVMRL